MPKLVFLNKNFEEQTYELLLPKTTVGRGKQNILVICDNSVSSTHCRIHVNGAEVIVEDLDSSNGTFVDGIRMKPQGQAKSGQVIRFGLVEARLELEPPRAEDDNTNISAIYDLAKFEAEERRKQREAHKDIAAKVEPSAQASGESSEARTVLIPVRRSPAPASADTTEMTTQPPKKGNLFLILVGIALFVAIGLVLWLSWDKK